MPLTDTSHLVEFTRPPPDSVTFTFPPLTSLSNDDGSRIPPMLITFRSGSIISTSLHWHATHTEYVKILSGAALVTVAGKTKIYAAGDGTATVPRHARHEWMRFDRPAHLLSKKQRGAQEAWMIDQGEEKVKELMKMDLVAEEWTDPKDGQKEVFFRNLFSTAGEPQWKRNWIGRVYIMLQVMCVMWEMDNPIVFIDMGGKGDGSDWRGRVEAAVTYFVMGFAALVGKMLQLKAVNKEYTPGHLMRIWELQKPEVKPNRKVN